MCSWTPQNRSFLSAISASSAFLLFPIVSQSIAEVREEEIKRRERGGRGGLEYNIPARACGLRLNSVTAFAGTKQTQTLLEDDLFLLPLRSPRPLRFRQLFALPVVRRSANQGSLGSTTLRVRPCKS